MQVALVCNSAFGTDGISLFVLNNHRYFKQKGITYHLIYSSIHNSQDVIDGYINDFCKNGDKTQFISKKNGTIEFMKAFFYYLKNEQIDVLHIHGSSSAILLEIIVAKFAGVKKIVSHAHSTGSNHNIIHKILRPFVNMLVKERLACGNKAGSWMYGAHRSFAIIPNGIDTKKYVFDVIVRKEVRDELCFKEKNTVLGHVGAFTEVKNQIFLLHLMKSLKERGKKEYKLLLIGDGPLYDYVVKECTRLNLNDSVYFLGNRNDVHRLMMSMDVFCMPSLYEGFPITAVEAQASGLPLLISNNVSSEVCITDLVHMLPIDHGTNLWEEELANILVMQYKREKYATLIKDSGYDIHKSAEMMESIYIRK